VDRINSVANRLARFQCLILATSSRHQLQRLAAGPRLAIPMHRNAVSHIRDAITLPFLFETRTILRVPCHTDVRSLSGSSLRYTQVTDERKSPTETKTRSFLKTKAAASKLKSKERNIGTTITAAERRVFDDIFNQVARKRPPKAAIAPQAKRDHFLDHEHILSIFSSAVSSHVAEQKAIAQKEGAEASDRHGRRALQRVLEHEEKVLQRYPKPLRKAARRATAAALAAEDPGTRGDLTSELVRNATPKSPVQDDLMPTELSQTDLGEAAAQHTELGCEQTHLNGEVGPSNSDELVNRRRAPLPGLRPPFPVADKKDEDVRQGLRPSFLSQSENVDEEETRTDLHIKPNGLRPSFITAELQDTFFQKGLRPSFLTTEKRAEDVASFAEHYGAVRPSFIRRAEDAAAVKEKLQHDPESVFQGTIHRYCRDEMEKIANSFQSVLKRHGDVGIWNTCLTRVFPMIELLDASLRKEKSLRDENFSQRKQVQEPTQKTSSEMPKLDAPIASIKSSPAESPLPDLPPYVPPLYIISRLYPAALLLAFRLLRTQFPTSPLALALLPQIRSLGPTSYVLGASTEFYNALIELRWDVYSDLQGIDRLLMEMERSGVEFDLGIWDILVKIGGERFTDLHDADGGTRGSVFWERPSNVGWFQKVAVEWKMVVAGRLREQGLGAEISEREYGAVILPESGPGNAEQETVWL
jgi:Mtf2 family